MAQPTTNRATFVEFALYITIGGAAAAVNLSVRYLLDIPLPFEISVILAYGAGMLAGLLLFQKLMFRGRSILQPQRIRRFALVNLFGVALAWTVSGVIARQLLPAIGWGWQPFEVAHIAGVAAPAICSYFLNKHYTFA